MKHTTLMLAAIAVLSAALARADVPVLLNYQGRLTKAAGAPLAYGLTAAIFSQVLVNIGMATGSLPVVGITLPFLSYGGSSLLVCMIAIGLLMNISMRRFTF